MLLYPICGRVLRVLIKRRSEYCRNEFRISVGVRVEGGGGGEGMWGENVLRNLIGMVVCRRRTFVNACERTHTDTLGQIMFTPIDDNELAILVERWSASAFGTAMIDITY